MAGPGGPGPQGPGPGEPGGPPADDMAGPGGPGWTRPGPGEPDGPPADVPKADQVQDQVDNHGPMCQDQVYNQT